MKSASSSQPVSFSLKAKEGIAQLKLLFRDRAPWMVRDYRFLGVLFDEYDELLTAHSGKCLSKARVFEIGCGQRPYRLMYLIARGVDAFGIDLDKVVDKLTPRVIANMYAANGFERTMKTVLRHVLFDRAENRQLNDFLTNCAGKHFAWPHDRIMHDTASNARAWPHGEFDFILSEDVFEHIPYEELDKVCAILNSHLSDRGIAFIRPMIFTGIQGGHNVEWYETSRRESRCCPPWDHLREHKFPANTYLNKLTLADYRSLFKRHFQILEEKLMRPNLGREYMTQTIRAELSAYSDEELYSNKIGFVLARKI